MTRKILRLQLFEKCVELADGAVAAVSSADVEVGLADFPVDVALFEDMYMPAALTIVEARLRRIVHNHRHRIDQDLDPGSR